MRTSSRRRFLAVSGATLLAGCSGSGNGEGEPADTVTPVDVPQSAGEVLAAVESVPVPSVPAAPVIAPAHRDAVVRYVEERIAAAETALAAAEDVEPTDVGPLHNAEAPLESCRQHVRAYESAPDRLRYRRIARTFDDVATILGYARAATDDLDERRVRSAADAATEASLALADGVEYRLASPVVERLPTVDAGEEALERAAGYRSRLGHDDGELDEAGREAIAEVWRVVESLRLETTNAAGYLDTGLDPSAPARADAIIGAVGSHLEAVAALDVPRRVDGRPVPARIRTVLSSVRSHRSEVLAAADPTDPTTARRLELLLDAVRIRNQLEAYNRAGEATFTRMGEEAFPTDLVMPAKRDAVERVETLVEAAPLARHLGGLADDMVTYGDRLEAGQGTDPVATAYFMYVAAAAYVDRALDRSERLAATLDPGSAAP